MKTQAEISVRELLSQRKELAARIEKGRLEICSMEEELRQINLSLKRINNELSEVKQEDESPGEELTKKVPELVEDLPGLSVRCMNVLRAEDIDTTSKLLTLTANEILKMVNLGRVSLMMIRFCLAEYGLKLKGDTANDVNKAKEYFKQ